MGILYIYICIARARAPPLYQYKPNQVDVYYYCAITYMYPCYLKMDVYRVIKLRHQQQKLYVLHKNTRLDMDMIPSANIILQQIL